MPVELTGPSGTAVVRFALDTGATSTLVNVGVLVSVGYDPALVSERVQVTTGSGVAFAPRVPLKRILALEQVRNDFHVLAHTLPPTAGIDGLLGLDFVRGQVLTVDFQKAVVALA